MLPRATARALGGHYQWTELARGGPTAAWQFERNGERRTVNDCTEEQRTANGYAEVLLHGERLLIQWMVFTILCGINRDSSKESERIRRELGMFIIY